MNLEDYKKELQEYTDSELDKAWDRLEKLRLDSYVESKMDAIREEQNKRILRANNK